MWVYMNRKWCMKSKWAKHNQLNVYCTAAIEGLESSPGWGCVTSAPKIMVGLSLTRGIRLESASTRTVFLPPTLTFIFKATLARYCLLILKTCFVKQHWDTIPRSVSQILFKSPTNNQKQAGIDLTYHTNQEATQYPHKFTRLHK